VVPENKAGWTLVQWSQRTRLHARGLWDHQAAYGVIFGAAQLQQPPPPPPLVLLPWRAQRGLVLLHGRRKGVRPLPNLPPLN
jgi:hypothetical protein